MTTQTEALNQAKQKIESAMKCHPNAVPHLLGEAWDFINEALMSVSDGAQPAVPQGHEQVGINGLTEAETNATASVFGLVNAAPPTQQSCSQRQCNVKPWVSLSDDEIIDCAADLLGDTNALLVIYFARAIEAKLKAKNERKEKNTHE